MKKLQAIFVLMLLFSGCFSPAGGSYVAYAQFVDNKATSQQAPGDQLEEETTVFDKVTIVINFLFGIVILASLLALIISALKFFVAGGSESMLSSANSTWIAAVIGLSIGLVGYVLISIIRYYLR